MYWKEKTNKVMKVKFFDIDWDLDDLNKRERKEVLSFLPSQPIIEVDDDTDINEEGADILSDEYGYCVYGFDYEILSYDFDY